MILAFICWRSRFYISVFSQIFALHVTRSIGTVLSPEHRREILRYIYNHQVYVYEFRMCVGLLESTCRYIFCLNISLFLAIHPFILSILNMFLERRRRMGHVGLGLEQHVRHVLKLHHPKAPRRGARWEFFVGAGTWLDIIPRRRDSCAAVGQDMALGTYKYKLIISLKKQTNNHFIFCKYIR